MALRIAVVGGGIGGLASAIAFRRQGHLVDVFEASAFTAEIGAALGVPPNCARILESFGYRAENLRSVDFMAATTFLPDGGPGVPHNQRDTRRDYGHQWVLTHRVDLHNELKRLAFEDGGDGRGPPAKLYLGRKVIGCDTTLGELYFADGGKHCSDLIIGADGIRSTIRTSVMGRMISPPPSGYSAFRWITHTSKLDGRTDLDWVYRKGPSGPRAIIHDSRFLFLYPCRDKTLINALLIHRDCRNQDSVGWNAEATREDLMSFASDFHPKFQAFLELAPEHDIRIWQLRSLPPLDTYFHGRAVLVGDAAHAMFPTLGQGAAMAIEDAAVLALLIPMGTTKSEISQRLQIYDKLRRPRDTFVQKESLDQAALDEKRGLYLRSLELQDKIMGFNALQLPSDAHL